MSIHKKLLLTFLAFSGVLILSIALLVKWSFHSNFRDYVTQQNLARMQEASERLADYYRDNGDWSALQANPRKLRRLLSRPLPPPEPGPSFQSETQPSPAPPPIKPRPPMQLFFLLDAEKSPVMGRPPQHLEHTNLVPIQLEGDTVGYIGFNTDHRSFSRMDERFARRQGEQLLYIVLMAIALSVLFAWPVSRFLVHRLDRLGRHIHHLSEGRYDERVTLHGRDELAQLGGHLNHLALILQSTEQSRRKWVADISHELRTPIATLRAQLEAIEDGVHPYNDSTHQRLARQTLRLQQLVEDLYQLSLADVGALQYRMQETAAGPLIEDCVNSFKARFRQAGLTLSCEIHATVNVLADPQRIQQLLSNLLENSLRYTQAPGMTKVSLARHRDCALLSVEDSSPGVADSQLESLFERFYRGESSRNRDTGGAGLGLNLCRAIAEAHQGSIQAQPSALGGLKIIVTLPLETP
ncbi:ATP-binding protein [Ketobacter sp.]|uniref:ATP-binding protein n=1 Tax=Ketobacter sp. TaxID=2083498 RepID=UPI0025C1EBAE|nr:ATP-binding protein [Ketobacter sp.]